MVAANTAKTASIAVDAASHFVVNTVNIPDATAADAIAAAATAVNMAAAVET